MCDTCGCNITPGNEKLIEPGGHLHTTSHGTESVEVLNHAAGFLRHRLGKMLHIRTVPELRFYLDRSLEEGARIGALINRAIASDRGEDEQD